MTDHAKVPAHGSRRRFAESRVTFLLLALLFVEAGSLGAQQASEPRRQVIIAPDFGMAIPSAGLADLEEAGVRAGVRLGYQVEPRLAFVLDVARDALRGTELQSGAKAPDMRLWHFTGGVEGKLLPSSDGPWSLLASAGMGATVFRSDPFQSGSLAGEIDFNETYVSAAGGLHLGYAVSQRMSVFADVRAHWANVYREETNALVRLDPTRLEKFGSATIVPITVGLRAYI